MNIELPKAPQKWTHYTGHVYTIVALARDSETQELIVVYKRDGKVWTRPLSDWVKLVNNRPIPGLGPSKNYDGPRFYRD